MDINKIIEEGEKEFDKFIDTLWDKYGEQYEVYNPDMFEKDILDWHKERQHKLLQSIVEEIDSEYEIAKNTKEFMQRSKWNEALDSLKAKLTSLNKTTNKV